jgi:hypothetical protein
MAHPTTQAGAAPPAALHTTQAGAASSAAIAAHATPAAAPVAIKTTQAGATSVASPPVPSPQTVDGVDSAATIDVDELALHIVDWTPGGNLRIGSHCTQVDPCVHSVSVDGAPSRSLSAPKIVRLCHERGVEAPSHFGHYRRPFSCWLFCCFC